LPLHSTLFQAPTIEKLARIIGDRQTSVTWSSLVPINPNGFKLPFFCVHAVGGNVLSYQRLARYLGVDRPFYGLQAIGLDGKRSPYKRIEDMAVHYLSEILSVQPNSPYFLGGHSFGGLIALEIAQQLYRQGHQVAFLGLFDTPVPHYVEELAPIERFAAHFNNISHLDLKERIIYVFEKFKLSIAQKIPRSINNCYWQLTNIFRSPQQLLNSKIARANQQALANYIPSVYPGKITLFRAKIKHLQNYFNPDLAWSQLALGGVELHEIPGNHNSFLLKKENSQVFAQMLKECLEKEHEYISNSRFMNLDAKEERIMLKEKV
jgi:thioesterase domain-containing protein